MKTTSTLAIRWINTLTCFALLLLNGCKPHDAVDVPSVQYTEVTPDLSDIYPTFTKVQFVSSQTGFVRGGRTGDFAKAILLTTKNGGQTWQSIRVDTLRVVNLIAFYALNEQTLFSTASVLAPDGQSGHEAFFKSTDGGHTWNLVSDTQRQDFKFALWFFNEQTGLGANPNGIERTEDGGRTWRKVETGAGDFPGFNHLQFLNEQTGFAYGGFSYDDRRIGGGYTNYGSLARTDDGGKTWRSISQSFGLITSSFFLTSQIGFVLTMEENYKMKFRQTKDGGLNWQVVNEAFQAQGELYFLNENEGFLSGAFSKDGGIYHTIDAGHSWRLEYRPDVVTPAMSSLSFPKGSKVGFAVGYTCPIVKIHLQ